LKGLERGLLEPTGNFKKSDKIGVINAVSSNPFSIQETEPEQK